MSVKNVKIRFNLDKENDRRAYDYLLSAEKSYSKAVISAICGYIELSEIPTARRSLNTTSRQSEKPNRKRLIWRFLLEAIRECTDLKELTPTIVNTLIKRIEVHNSEKGEDGLKHVPIDISFTAVGIINIPTEKELIAAMEEMRENPLKSAWNKGKRWALTGYTASYIATVL